MKKEEMNSGEHLRSHSSFIIGIVAIVLAVFNPIPGVVLGIIGLVQSSKQKDMISKKSKRLNIIAIIVGVVIAVASILLANTLASLASI